MFLTHTRVVDVLVGVDMASAGPSASFLFWVALLLGAMRPWDLAAMLDMESLLAGECFIYYFVLWDFWDFVKHFCASGLFVLFFGRGELSQLAIQRDDWLQDF